MADRKKRYICTWEGDMLGSKVGEHKHSLMVFHMVQSALVLDVDTNTLSLDIESRCPFSLRVQIELDSDHLLDLNVFMCSR